MRLLLFLRLAVSGIVKNKKLYIPYTLSGLGMVMMYYILHSLSVSSLLDEMKGGSDIGFVLSLGKFIITIFALLFLFYTNSFLVRRRYREYGLYSVLGMDKKGISAIVFFESLITGIFTVIAGIILGIVFSKLAELGLLNSIKKEIDYSFTVEYKAVGYTFAIFSVIYLILMFKSVISVSLSNPLKLIKSESAGEKPPKANLLSAVAGVIILGLAYYIAISIKSPISALTLFFLAVIMVIVATYLLFISGSVTLCRLLQKNKKYYYKKNHFISVSSMVYRMKRNGAGLASICILITMVLVMFSSTASLYFGANESLNSRYPYGNEILIRLNSISDAKKENIDLIKNDFNCVFHNNNLKPKRADDFCTVSITGMLEDKKIEPDINNYRYSIITPDKIRTLYFLSEQDYNRQFGTNIKLNGNEALLYTKRCEYDRDTISISGINLKISGKVSKYPDIVNANVMLVPSMLFVISDYNVLSPLEELVDNTGEKMLYTEWSYRYDLNGDKECEKNVLNELSDAISNIEFLKNSDGVYSYTTGCKSAEKDDFFVTFGGMFFLGIILSLVFLFAAAMIIYYKQISEGYEDVTRFRIMQKVGMTKADIKKSINSQVLTVFFAPIIMSGIHLAFAFPLVWKILQLFNMYNLKFIIIITVLSFLAFGLLYVILYKITAKAYYSIVSN